MRILATSDIHNNFEAVQQLRIIERNSFDVIVVAGDFGSERLDDILGILLTFDCPVLYILGNWDSKVPYTRALDSQAVHLHESVYATDEAIFIGYSGCYAHWGLNPIAKEEKEKLFSRHPDYDFSGSFGGVLKKTSSLKGPRRQQVISDFKRDFALTYKRIQSRNEQSIIKRAERYSKVGLPIVAVSHSRTYRVDEKLPGCVLHLFGHRHGFRDTVFRDVRVVNVSALDDRTMVDVRSLNGNHHWDAIFNFGTYTKIKIMNGEVNEVECKRLYPDNDRVSRYAIKVIPEGDRPFPDFEGAMPSDQQLSWFHARPNL